MQCTLQFEYEYAHAQWQDGNEANEPHSVDRIVIIVINIYAYVLLHNWLEKLDFKCSKPNDGGDDDDVDDEQSIHTIGDTHTRSTAQFNLITAFVVVAFPCVEEKVQHKMPVIG